MVVCRTGYRSPVSNLRTHLLTRHPGQLQLAEESEGLHSKQWHLITVSLPHPHKDYQIPHYSALIAILATFNYKPMNVQEYVLGCEKYKIRTSVKVTEV